jgi:hypothetical protein
MIRAFFFFFFFFWQYWGLNSGATPESLHQPFLWRVFRDSISRTICPGWLWTVILLICASWVARITGVSPAWFRSLGGHSVALQRPEWSQEAGGVIRGYGDLWQAGDMEGMGWDWIWRWRKKSQGGSWVWGFEEPSEWKQLEEAQCVFPFLCVFREMIRIK